MKALLSMAVAFGVCGLANAADAVGTWKCSYEIGEQKRTCTLKVKKDGDKLAATIDWPDQKNEKVKDLKLTDGTLKFSAVRKFMGNEIEIEYTLKIEGDELKGKGAADFNGNKNEFDITGKREKAEKK